ncbi:MULTISPECIES: helix-turn-helix domain-containing protein [Asticcacaulis]|uniref:winged helix-turn-helix transcriptional regulator n=1 Tax=Asticcacaulis TaxID=76890 RepID=UPI001AE760EF|nr:MULTISPECIES: helix-turn-helix domain-containing protein [Asticcacaulis]MBP2160365.1 DNA-binding HxlR family transcriptional regulator [Asticcacaulis solisilvae]MDR6801332.1 DNA-binding HxlR family transcriptional regulator [Asticcacaulis sp. BE141]
MTDPASVAFRSTCPLASVLDIIGDKWTLVIMRDMLAGKTRFSEFLDSPEGLSPRVLSQRLSFLESQGMIQKVQAGRTHPAYVLTDKAMELKEVGIRLAEWGLRHIPGRVSPYLDKFRDED